MAELSQQTKDELKELASDIIYQLGTIREGYNYDWITGTFKLNGVDKSYAVDISYKSEYEPEVWYDNYPEKGYYASSLDINLDLFIFYGDIDNPNPDDDLPDDESDYVYSLIYEYLREQLEKLYYD